MIFDILLYTIEGVSFYTLLTTLSYKQKEYKFLRIVFLSLFYSISLILVKKAVPFGIHTLLVLVFIIITGTIFLYLDIVTSTIHSLIALLLNGFVNFIVILFFLFAFGINPNTLVTNPTWNTWANFGTQVLFLLSAIIIYKTKFQLIKKNIIIQKYNIVFVYILSLATILFLQLAVLSIHIQDNDITPYVFLILSFIFILFITYQLYLKVIDFISQEKQLDEQKIYISYIQELIAHLRAQRHEFVNHMNVLYGLVQIKEVSRLDKAKKYIEEYDFAEKATSHLLAIQDPILSGLLYTKISIAERKNIQVDIDITEDFSSTKLTLPEISVLIGNLFNNAIEFCENLEPTERYIYVQIYGDDSKIYIAIYNNHGEHILTDSMKTQIFEKGFSTKTHQAGDRGYGLYNVKQILNKYDGHIDIVYEDELVCFKIQLPRNIAEAVEH